MKLALVTYADEGKYPGEGTREDAQLLEYLTQHGLEVKYQIWTDNTVDWRRFDILILKSPWDYFDKVKEFRQWLNYLELENIKVLNPIPVVRWNMAKNYLLDVEKAGFPIVPTSILAPKSTIKANTYFQLWPAGKLVVKPVISGGAKNTFILSPGNNSRAESEINKLLQTESFLVQPFINEILNRGEWSLIYFNGQFSHCVLKQPQPGDFRVQHYFGGSITPKQPPEFIINHCNKLVKQFATGCLYARVDGVETEGEFWLMELELIEPMLYLLYKPEALDNYRRALEQML